MLHIQALLSVGYLLTWRPALHGGKQGAYCQTQPAKIIVAEQTAKNHSNTFVKSLCSLKPLPESEILPKHLLSFAYQLQLVGTPLSGKKNLLSFTLTSAPTASNTSKLSTLRLNPLPSANISAFSDSFTIPRNVSTSFADTARQYISTRTSAEFFYYSLLLKKSSKYKQ